MNYRVYLGNEGVRFTTKITGGGFLAKATYIRFIDGQEEDCASIERWFKDVEQADTWQVSQEKDLYEAISQVELEELTLQKLGADYL